MSRFKVGDIVRISKSSFYYGRNDYNPADEDGIVILLNSVVDYKYTVDWGGKTNRYRGEDLDRGEDNKGNEMERLYKIETGLSLQQVKDLSNKLVFTTAFVELHNELHDIYRKAQRKVVKVGDREYYEDELATALANIKPIK